MTSVVGRCRGVGRRSVTERRSSVGDGGEVVPIPSLQRLFGSVLGLGFVGALWAR
jgi:hypothetical protein